MDHVEDGKWDRIGAAERGENRHGASLEIISLLPMFSPRPLLRTSVPLRYIIPGVVIVTARYHAGDALVERAAGAYNARQWQVTAPYGKG